ncbi:MAG: class I SAM-dependent methyltransferase [bacterium]
MSVASPEARFREAYGAHRASEGRALSEADSLALPYLEYGPHARQWAVRARTFDAFLQRVLTPLARAKGRPLRLLDLGAGNGWLSWRTALAGHESVAIDVRDDDVDGLRAGESYLRHNVQRMSRVAASFDHVPIRDASADIVVFNASLHYAVDLRVTLEEARRVSRSGGRIVILDSPFYQRDADGEAMVAEKRGNAERQFGERAEALMQLSFIEFLTMDRLHRTSAGLGVTWRRHRVRYPFWYEMRPLLARARGARRPSRFDLWEGVVA